MKTQKKLSVTIGIPAYNEEANIGYLLRSILEQKETNFTLEEIIVVSDKSTDNTESEVRKVKDRRIKLLINEKRSGQAIAQNKVLKIFNSDVLVILNGDILIKSQDFISKITNPIIRNSNIGLASIRHSPLKASTLFEEIINFSVKFKTSLFENWRQGCNIFTCKGSGRAFSKAFAKKFTWPKLKGEDAYTYMKVLEEGFKYSYVKNEQIYYKSPENFHDHLNQSHRFFSNRQELYTFFSKKLVDQEYAIPKLSVIQESLRYFLMNPIYFATYIFIVLYAKFIPSKPIGKVWEPPRSTKNLLGNI